jgi:CPA2 family monovalent cation:H+ antiporter-2
MLIDPALIARHWGAILTLTVVVIAGKFIGVSLGAFLAGNGTRASVQAGMSLAQIGEFSFIIAALGISLGATRDFLYPVAVSVSALTTLSTPWLIRGSGPTASWIDGKLPGPLQTFVSLYGSWIERLRAAPRESGRRARLRRLGRLLVLDTLILAALVMGAAVEMDTASAILVEHLAVADGVARAVVVAVAALLASPFVIGLFRVIRRLGLLLGESALPRGADGALDLAAAPRRALVVTLQLSIVLAVVVQFVALSHPFLPGAAIAAAVGAILLGFGVAFWRTATNLHGHAKAGAQLIIEALAAQSGKESSSDPQLLADAREMLPGLGMPVPVRIASGSPVVGKTLAELDLRGLTGATVLAIGRGEESILIPTAGEVLRAGDVVALAGTQESVGAAASLLRGAGNLESVPPI